MCTKSLNCKTPFACDHHPEEWPDEERAFAARSSKLEHQPTMLPAGGQFPRTLLEQERAEHDGHCLAASEHLAARLVEEVDGLVDLIGWHLALPKMFGRSATVRKAMADSVRALVALKVAAKHFGHPSRCVPPAEAKRQRQEQGRLIKMNGQLRAANQRAEAAEAKLERIEARDELRREKRRAARARKPSVPAIESKPEPMPKLIAERMAGGGLNGHANGVLNGKH